MKRNKSKGFTLIELMVVISIISLLSSVVLASIKAAREKALLAKAVGEMKSLVNAVELYRSANGTYPGLAGGYYDDDNVSDGYGTDNGNLNTFIQTNLVTPKFLGKVVNAPYYPNNCKSDCNTNGYVLGYYLPDLSPGGP